MQPVENSGYSGARDLRTNDSEYVAGLVQALRSPTDVWGREVLVSPSGPNYENIEPYLVPSMLADPNFQTPVPYVPLGKDADSDTFALHVLDGSHLIAEGLRNWLIAEAVLPNGEEAELTHRPSRVTGTNPRFFFSVTDDEPFGQQLDRLAEPRLAKGFLPVLLLEYIDSSGVHWHRESYVNQAANGPLVSWLRFTVTADRDVKSSLSVRMDVPDMGNLLSTPFAVTTSEGVLLRSSLPLELHGDAARIDISLVAGQPFNIVLCVANSPDKNAGVEPISVDEGDAARAGVDATWIDALDSPTRIDVPEERVMSAMRNLLLQNLTMGHRYSIGNPYERTFLMEGHLSIQPLLWFGFADRHRSELLELAELTNGAGEDWYESWERGAKMSAIAEHYRLTGDETILIERAEAHRGYLESLTGMIANDPLGLLSPERYAWDIPEVIYGTHSQSVAWRGMSDILAAYRFIGHPIADEFQPAVESFGSRLREEITAAEVRLPDGSLFVPVPLAPDSEPFKFLPATREGNYWNLVFPFALTSGILSLEQRRDLMDYMDAHGSFFLGLTRFSGLYEPIPVQGDIRPTGTAGYKVAGIDNAFGIHHMLALADLEYADRVALCLYSKLAHGMTRGTYLDGEATTLGAVPGEYYRSSWYPPNSTSNSLFLLTLRTILAHEHVDSNGTPVRLALAPSTPRHWLEGGNRVGVEQLPTSFGNVTYSIDSYLGDSDRPRLEVSVELNMSRPARAVELSLRVPASWKVDALEGPEANRVLLDGDRLHLDPLHQSFRVCIRYSRIHEKG